MVAVTELLICNLALGHLRITRPITDTGGAGTLAGSADDTEPKRGCDLHYPVVRDALLTQFPWPFARIYATLTVDSASGDGKAWNQDWQRSFLYPADCLRTIRFANDRGSWGYGVGGSALDDDWWWIPHDQYRYVIRRDGTTKVILTDVTEADAQFEYVEAVTDATAFDTTFAHTLSFALAAALVPHLGLTPEWEQSNLMKYQISLTQARAKASNEQAPRRPKRSSFERSRSGS